jgi:deoxyribose-phosphate aldolase
MKLRKNHMEKNINALIDHTNLKNEASAKDIKELCEEATKYSFRGICINSLWIPLAYESLKNENVKIISVCDFPLGASSAEIRKKEAELILKTGSKEIDIVMQISLLKSKEYDKIEKDIKEITNLLHPDVLMKVIIEAPILNKEEIITAAKIAENAGADFIKSGTGTKGPVTVYQIETIRKATRLPIKAAGGIKNLDEALGLLNAGASILGSSSSIEIVKENQRES